MATHRVAQGESLYSIARKYKISWEALRDHPANAELKRKRPHPQILHPGDVLELPDAGEGLPLKLDARVEFTRRPQDSQPLRLTLEHVDGTPMRSTDFTLAHEGGTIEGRTDANGVLDSAVPVAARKCTLTAGGYSWELDVAHLNPLAETDDDGVSGCQGRLRNLGYYAGDIDGRESKELERAISIFQVAHGLARTGKLDAATRGKLLDRHGC